MRPDGIQKLVQSSPEHGKVTFKLAFLKSITDQTVALPYFDKTAFILSTLFAMHIVFNTCFGVPVLTWPAAEIAGTGAAADDGDRVGTAPG